MSKRALFCASTISHIRNFHLPYLKAFHELGYEVWVAADKIGHIPYADNVVQIPFDKHFISYKNIEAMFIAKKLLMNQNFEFISTHTTLASAVMRTAVLLMYHKPTVFCTVHGYLFNDNDGMKKWFFLLPEKICSKVTDVLMVMNQEDYSVAEKYRLYRNRLNFINGMGIDLDCFTPATPNLKFETRRKQGFNVNDFIYLYAAEFSHRKNHSLLIRAFANVSKEYPNMKLLLAGDGLLLERCKSLARELEAEEQILFLGYVNEMKGLYSIADAVVSPSRSEGLPFHVMEAMASGLPVIASKIKGHMELVNHEETGLLFELGDQAALEEALIRIFNDREKQTGYGQNGLKTLQKYGLDQVFQQIMNIYCENI